MAPVKDVLLSTGYRLAWKVICRVPESWARWGFDTATNIAWRRQGPGVQMLENNLLRVLGPETTGKELRRVSKAGMQSYGRYWMEVFRLPTISADQIQQKMLVNPDAEQALADAAAGQGVIFALPHMGNWEVAGAFVVGRGIKFTTVAERLKPESVFDMFVAFREGLGMEVLPLGSPSIFGVLAQRLRAGHMVCLLCDRDLTESGVEVDFFGEKARMAAGPAALAIQTGATLYGVTLWFTEDGWVAHCTPIPVPAEGTRKEKAAVSTRDFGMAVCTVATIGPDATQQASMDRLGAVGSCTCRTSKLPSLTQRRTRLADTGPSDTRATEPLYGTGTGLTAATT